MPRKLQPHTKQALSESEEALANALDHLEGTRIIRQDDPALLELKDDIRRSITKP